MTATVTSNGQITIPKRVRELMGIGPGSTIDFVRAKDGRIVQGWTLLTRDVGRYRTHFPMVSLIAPSP